MNDEIKDLIGRADEKISKTTAAAETQPEKNKKQSVGIGLVLGLLLVNIAIFYSRATTNTEDQSSSPLPLIELVDAYIRGEYERSGVLPEQIYDAVLSSLVNYQVLDSHTYELQLLVEGDDTTPVVISVARPLDLEMPGASE